MSVLEDLNWRYATKEFDNTKILPQETLDTVYESLRLSASSFGLQPWKFVIVENKDLREKLLPSSWNQRQVVDASHLIVFCRPTSFGNDDIDRFLKSTAETRNVEMTTLEGYGNMMKGFVEGKTKSNELNTWMKDQIYIALGSLLSTCAQLRIDACPMEGFSAPDYDEILGLTALGLTSAVLCPIGHRAQSDKYATLAKVRYPLAEVMHKI